PLYVCSQPGKCDPFPPVLGKYYAFASNYVQDHVCSCFLPKVIVEARVLIKPTPICFMCYFSHKIRDFTEARIICHGSCERHSIDYEPPCKRRLVLDVEEQ
nr:2A2+2A3 [Seal picornavirus type 1]